MTGEVRWSSLVSPKCRELIKHQARLVFDYPDYYSGLIIVAAAVYPIGDGSYWYNKLATAPVLGHIFRHAVVTLLGPLISSKFVEQNFHPDDPVPGNYQQQACLNLLFLRAGFLPMPTISTKFDLI